MWEKVFHFEMISEWMWKIFHENWAENFFLRFFFFLREKKMNRKTKRRAKQIVMSAKNERNVNKRQQKPNQKHALSHFRQIKSICRIFCGGWAKRNVAKFVFWIAECLFYSCELARFIKNYNKQLKLKSDKVAKELFIWPFP